MPPFLQAVGPLVQLTRSAQTLYVKFVRPVEAALFHRLYFGSPTGYVILQAQGGPLVEFMGVSIGVLALICALVLLFGMQEARRILACTFGLVLVGAVHAGAVVWIWRMWQQRDLPLKFLGKT